MKRRTLILTALLLGTTAALPAGAADYPWKPDKPITIIVPWAAGGSTDQVTRIAAGEIEQALGQNVVVVNQPGASGSIGTKAVLDGPKDGYTWTAGAAQDLGTYGVLGMLDTRIGDWHLYLDVANVPLVGVNADTPWKTMQDLLGRHEGQARPDHGGDGRPQLQRPHRDRIRSGTRPASSTRTSPMTAAIRR